MFEGFAHDTPDGVDNLPGEQQPEHDREGEAEEQPKGALAFHPVGERERRGFRLEHGHAPRRDRHHGIGADGGAAVAQREVAAVHLAAPVERRALADVGRHNR